MGEELTIPNKTRDDRKNLKKDVYTTPLKDGNMGDLVDDMGICLIFL